MKGYIFVATPGTNISKKGNVIVVETKERKVQIPIGTVKHVFLFGMVNITAPAIRLLSSRGKFVFLLNRYGRLTSVVYPELFGSDNTIRVAQYSAFSDDSKKVEIVKEILKRKLETAKLVIHNLYASRSLKPENLQEWSEGVKVSILSAETVQTLLGVDGNISRYLYGKFSSFNENPFYFERREYYPPPDPVNALLSLSFSIFYSIMHPIVLSAGFDPYLGFFHAKRGRHAVLCSDVMEIVRPKLAEFVFNALNDGFFEKGDFSKDKGGVFLKTEALKAFIKLFSDVVIHNRNDYFFSEVVSFLNWLKAKVKSG